MKHACQSASRLASDSLDRKLGLWERLKFNLHLLICKNCSNCDDNLKLIHATSALIQQTRYGEINLSDEQRKRLHQQLDQHSETAAK